MSSMINLGNSSAKGASGSTNGINASGKSYADSSRLSKLSSNGPHANYNMPKKVDQYLFMKTPSKTGQAVGKKTKNLDS